MPMAVAKVQAKVRSPGDRALNEGRVRAQRLCLVEPQVNNVAECICEYVKGEPNRNHQKYCSVGKLLIAARYAE